MENWVGSVEELMDSDFRMEVEKKIEEFKSFKRQDPEAIFSELCFCILTANTSAELGISMQKNISPYQFLNLEKNQLRDSLKESRYRFYNTRSNYISSNRWIASELPLLLNHPDHWVAREFLVENLKGIGYKEASHFLRNCGVFDFAILDKHIIRMVSGMSDDTGKPLNKKRYYSIEKKLSKIASELSVEPGILDLYMWKLATGKLIK